MLRALALLRTTNRACPPQDANRQANPKTRRPLAIQRNPIHSPAAHTAQFSILATELGVLSLVVTMSLSFSHGITRTESQINKWKRSPLRRSGRAWRATCMMP
jgi:hypothetical protein